MSAAQAEAQGVPSGYMLLPSADGGTAETDAGTCVTVCYVDPSTTQGSCTEANETCEVSACNDMGTALGVCVAN